MSLLKKIKDKTGTVHDIGDSRVDAYETELSGAEHNVPYSPAVLAKTNAIEEVVSEHVGNTANPHKVTKEQLGLSNVENKSSTRIRSELTKENVTNALGYTPIDESRIGAANGVASLDASGRIPASQIPGGFDNIEEYENLAGFPATGEEGKIYVAKDTNLTYRWTGSQYVEISPSLALGETATTAYRGDRGKTAYDHSQVSGNSTVHHVHENKELLDTYTQTEADLANAVAKVHEHGNKSVLDGITSDKVTSWDGKEDAFDVLPLSKGGTGAATKRAAEYNIMGLEEIETTISDDRKLALLNQTVSSSNGVFRWIKASYIWTYIKGKISSVLGLTETDYAGKAATAGTADKAVADNSGNDIEETYATKTELATKQNALTFDTTPTKGSTNPVTSGGIKTALDLKADSSSLNNYVVKVQDRSGSSHVKDSEYYSFVCRTPISSWDRIQTEFFCLSSDSSNVGKLNIYVTVSSSDTTLHTAERVASLGGIVWDYNFRGFNSIKYKIYVAKSGDYFYFYAKRNSSNTVELTAFCSKILFTTKSEMTDDKSYDLDDATWQTLTLVEMTNVYTSTTQERLSGEITERKNADANLQTAIDTEASSRESADTTLQTNIDTVDAKGIVVKEIDGEQVICFE